MEALFTRVYPSAFAHRREQGAIAAANSRIPFVRA